MISEVNARNDSIVNIDSIRNFIQNEIMDDTTACIHEDDDLILTQVLDSQGIMRLVAYIEETWIIKVPPEDITLENFGSLRQMDNYLNCRGDGAH